MDMGRCLARVKSWRRGRSSFQVDNKVIGEKLNEEKKKERSEGVASTR